MNFIEFLKNTETRREQLILTFILVVLYFIYRNVSARLISRFGKRNKISLPRVKYTVKFFIFIGTTVSLVLLGLIWDISFQGLSVYFLSFFTVAGIGLFASWSILSNITAAVILFFYFPYKIGAKIRIIDGDNSVEGILYDLNLFSIIIKTDDGKQVTYPNNLALQKAIKLIEEAPE